MGAVPLLSVGYVRWTLKAYEGGVFYNKEISSARTMGFVPVFPLLLLCFAQRRTLLRAAGTAVALQLTSRIHPKECSLTFHQILPQRQQELLALGERDLCKCCLPREGYSSTLLISWKCAAVNEAKSGQGNCWAAAPAHFTYKFDLLTPWNHDTIY